MDNKVINQMHGIITVRLSGINYEKVINMALMRGIYIWDIIRQNDGLEFKIRRSAYEAVANIAADNGMQMEIIRLQGIPFWKKVIKERSGLLSGALLFILAIYLMSSFVWFIDVKNNLKVDNSTIMVTAAKHGLYRGAGKWSFSRREVEKAILVDLNLLSYVKVDIRGVKATIEVVEKILPGDEITGPCHIVAAKDGVVEEILLLEGQKNVEEGEAVTKGDILISGIKFYRPENIIQGGDETEGEEIQPETVRARGIVRARVWYEGYGECNRVSKKIIYTGGQNRQIMIKSPWKEFIVYGDKETGFQQFDQKIKSKEFKSPWGTFGWTNVVNKEKNTIITQISENEAVRIAREKAVENIKNKMNPGQHRQDLKNEIISSPSDPVLRCRVSIEVIEDIARAEPINEQ
jgi:similar to stage IV sporulation protein